MSDEDDWDEANLPFHGHPVVATLAGLAVIVLSAVFLPRYFPDQPLNLLLAYGAGLAFVLWVIGFALTVRRSPLLWKAGSLAVLLIAGLLGGYGAHVLTASQAYGDATTLAEADVDLYGGPVFPRDARARGPVSRLFVETGFENANDSRAYGVELGKLGVGALNSPYELQHAPAVLGQCDAIGKLRPLAEQVRAKRGERLKAVLAGIDRAPLDEALKKGMRMMLAPGESPEQLDTLLAVDLETLVATQDLCRLFAKKSWSNQGGYFGFSSGADRAAYQAIDKRRQEASGKATSLQRAGKERFLAGRTIVRDILDVRSR